MTTQINKTAYDFGKVAVLYGGTSQEREVSLASGKAVHNALVDAGINASLFDTAHKPLHHLTTEQFTRAFIILHGRGGEDGTIQGALEHLQIPYTGSGVQGSAIAMDKIISKQIWQAVGLPTALYVSVTKDTFEQMSPSDVMHQLGGSVMVKPVKEGSSIGMTKVDKPELLSDAVSAALEFDNEVLIEQYINGKEYTVTIVNGKAYPSIRMSTPHVFYDYDAKYKDNTTEYFCPSGLHKDDEASLQDLAVQAFVALKGRGWGRIDFMQDNETGKFFLLESNTVPGMTPTSLVPKSAKQAGLSFQDLVCEILADTLN